MTDRQLIEQFAAGDSAAFEELARRHAGWIQCLAHRQLHNTALAEDATQAVFLVLIQKAKSLKPSVHIAGWLYRTAILACKETARREARQKRREEQAAMLRPEQPSEENNAWTRISPLLERMMNRLRQRDREAILLRFYAQRSYAEVAAEMGINEEAARKRVERALQKLRLVLARHGIQQPMDLLGSALLMHTGGATSMQLISQIAGNASSQTVRRIAAAAGRKFSLGKLGLTGTSLGMIGVAALIATAKLSSSSRPTPSTPKGTMPAWLQAIAKAPSEVPTFPPAKITFDELIGHLQQAESRIKNLHIVHFRTTLQERSAYDKPWENTPAVWEGSAWFDGNFHGRCRIFLRHDAQRWYPTTWGKDLVWTEDSNDYGFDGAEGRMIRLTNTGTFHAGGKTIYRPVPGREGEISSGLPLWINNRFMRYFTGVACSLQYIVQEGEDTTPPKPRESLVQKLLRYHRIAPKDLLMVQSEINGVKVVGIQTRPYRPPAGWEVWWFDPSRGYALVRYVIHNFSSTPHGIQLNATRWKEAAPGIWFPTAGTVEENYSFPNVRFTYHAEDVIANDPKFRPGIFQVPLPVGFLIYDRRKNPPQLFMVMDDGEERDIHRGDAIPRVKPDVPRPPAN